MTASDRLKHLSRDNIHPQATSRNYFIASLNILDANAVVQVKKGRGFSSVCLLCTPTSLCVLLSIYASHINLCYAH